MSAEEIYSASSLSTDASGAIEDMIALAAVSWASRLNFFMDAQLSQSMLVELLQEDSGGFSNILQRFKEVN